MKKVTLLTTFLLFVTGSIFSQKTLTIQKMTALPVIDGDVSDSVWSQVLSYEGFTMAYPQFGGPSQSGTAFKMGYTDNGIYIAAFCTSAKVRSDGSIRDEKGTGDYLSVGFDTWNDDQYAFVFTVGASGQRTEERVSSNQTESGFDTPWLASTSIQANGWTAEIFIPFRSVRYQRDGLQDWGIQFTRFDRSTGETSTWSPQSPLIEDIVWQYGHLEGLNIEKQRERFGITNQSGYHKDWYRQYLIANDSNYYDYKYKGVDKAESRLDGRWGPSPNTTIDLTLIPALAWNNYKPYDFPMAQSAFTRSKDPNLSGNRPLEMEENSLFNKTTPLRLINGLPFEYFKTFAETGLPASLSTTDGGQLINQIKMTARPAKTLSVGVSNAVYSQMRETYYNFITGKSSEFISRKYPVVNHVSIEKVFRNNSWFQISNVHEFLRSPNAFNIASAAGQWRDKSNHYELSGNIGLETIQKSDNVSRLRGQASIRKINGVWVWNASYISHGQRYNPDFNLTAPSSYLQIVQGGVSKRNFHPANSNWLNTSKGISSSLYIDHKKQKPEFLIISTYCSGLNKQYNRMEIYGGIVSLRQDELIFDPFNDLTRKIPPSVVFNGKWSSDERKRLWLELSGGLEKNLLQTEDTWSSNGMLRYAPHHQWRFTVSWSYFLETNNQSVINEISPEYGVEKSNRQNIFMDANVLFMPIPKLAVGAGISHNGFQVSNRRSFILIPDGSLQPVEFNFTNNQNTQNSQPELFLAWYISPLRQIKVSWHNSRDITHNLNITTPFAYDFHNNINTLNISAIFSLYN